MTTIRCPSVCTSRGTRTGGGCLAKSWYTPISCRCLRRHDGSPSGSALIMTGWSSAYPAASSELPSWGNIFSTRSPANWLARAASAGGTRRDDPPDASFAASSRCINSVTVPPTRKAPELAVLRAVQFRYRDRRPTRTVCKGTRGVAGENMPVFARGLPGTGYGPSSRHVLRGSARAAKMVPVTGVYLEVGTKRVFACAVDWPGWCRSGRGEQQALDALATTASRYAVLAALASIPFDPVAEVDCIEITETVTGSATTDFGALDVAPALDARPVTAQQASRLAVLVQTAWDYFEQTAAASPPVLRKGPRGGGRDRDQIIEHVHETEVLHARMLGLKERPFPAGDTAALARVRAAILAEIRAGVVSGAPAGLGRSRRPARFVARRTAWHAVDHAWEIQDKQEP